MGMNPMGKTSHLNLCGVVSNPDPLRWTLVQGYQMGDMCVVCVKYTGCTNYDGKKVMVYENARLRDLTSGKIRSLDPHFDCRNVNDWVPFARFEPTRRGWNAACLLAARLQQHKYGVMVWPRHFLG
jgi:hypothetical protein